MRPQKSPGPDASAQQGEVSRDPIRVPSSGGARAKQADAKPKSKSSAPVPPALSATGGSVPARGPSNGLKGSSYGSEVLIVYIDFPSPSVYVVCSCMIRSNSRLQRYGTGCTCT